MDIKDAFGLALIGTVVIVVFGYIIYDTIRDYFERKEDYED